MASGAGFHSKCTGACFGSGTIKGGRFRGSARSGGARTLVFSTAPPAGGTVTRSHLPISTCWRPSVVANSAVPADTVMSDWLVCGSLRTAARLFCLTDATAFENETSALDLGESHVPVVKSTAPDLIFIATPLSLSLPTEFSSTVTIVSAYTQRGCLFPDVN